MKTFNIISKRLKFGKFTTTIQSTFTGTTDQAIIKMLEEYQEINDSNYFPNDEQKNVTDCSGNVIWVENQTYIGDNDFEVYIEEIENTQNEVEDGTMEYEYVPAGDE